ncbi:MAG: UDP-N-acetylmuramoyl-L-alanyl-D-glutamate--2,6-diaminopimelate ligase [Phycisphaerae bacterium]|nr:UDP-N-acetylmuramoyl-L-alanyl-D-glutamate--2,6-diaminopimelate ligase [Phycisphaerae bacterium]
MLLGELIRGLNIHATGKGSDAVRICDLTEDSRTVLPGSLFIARPGTKADGRRFIEQAIAADAVAVLTTPDVQAPDSAADLAWLTAGDVPLAEARIAERFFGNPSSKLTLIGATGTNGKTTVTHLVHQLLNDADMRCGLIGTTTIDDGGRQAKATLTTPPAIELSYTLSKMLDNGCAAASMEVSSHSLDQQRVAALDFDIAVFTNLTGDHLDYHQTMERYAAAKARLFESLKPAGTAIVNADDPAHRTMTANCRARILRCSAGNDTGAECTAEAGRMTFAGMPITLRGPWGTIEGHTRLIGAFNVMNILQAVAAAHAAGVERDDIALSLFHLQPPPGRLERVSRVASPAGSNDIAVFVDYAHTDDALAKAIAAVRPLLDDSGGNLRVVFGCGGDRDRTKRPRMARVAASLADEVFITSDNPRTEKPLAIIDDILAGIDTDSARKKIHVEPDRRAAIILAIESARPGDAVLIAGKGHEDYQLVSDNAGGILRLDFDDRIVAHDALKARVARDESAKPAANPGEPART